MTDKFLSQKLIKFLVGGAMATAINLFLIYFFIDKLGFNTPILRNVANVIAIEISLLASFFIYRIWVWKGGDWTWQNVLLKQIPLYHISAGTAILLRVLVVFPFIDWLGINYGVNTVIGALLSASINYLISDRYVFKENNTLNQNENNNYPEAFFCIRNYRKSVSTTRNVKTSTS